MAKTKTGDTLKEALDKPSKDIAPPKELDFSLSSRRLCHWDSAECWCKPDVKDGRIIHDPAGNV